MHHLPTCGMRYCVKGKSDCENTYCRLCYLSVCSLMPAPVNIQELKDSAVKLCHKLIQKHLNGTESKYCLFNCSGFEFLPVYMPREAACIVHIRCYNIRVKQCDLKPCGMLCVQTLMHKVSQ